MKTAALLKDFAFVIHPVADINRARAFYERVLGLSVTASWEDQWIEYDIGAGTLVITKADENHQPGRHGPTVALEVTDLDAVIATLRDSATPIGTEPWDSPACRGCIIRDPDQNEIMLHARKQNREDRK